jgi:hypothetical protein
VAVAQGGGGERVLFERKEIKEEEEGGSLWKQGC